MSLFLLIGGLVTFAGVWWGSGWVRWLALKQQVFDYPNERSLHQQPIPKGGGFALVLSLVLGAAVWVLGEGIEVPLSLVVGFLVLWITGLVEDYSRVPIKIRLPVQVLASLLVIAYGEPSQNFLLPKPFDCSLGMAQWPLSLFWLLAVTNAFNFMDGIDGLAASHLPVIGAALALLNLGGFVKGISILMGIAGLAFLRWNREPAQIFMGDSGAIPLGFLLAALPFYITFTTTHTGVLVLAVLLGLFLFDTGYTLIGRMLRKERVWEAHRSHLYQRLVFTGMTHTQVSALLLSGTLLISVVTLIAYHYAFTLWVPLMAVILLGCGLVGYTKRREKGEH